MVEPFERGFGTTIGNSLRRVLLAALEGSAITRVSIAGIQHEFSTIPGIVEDVTDIVLNLKSLVVKSHSEEPKAIRIDRSHAGLVTAADIIHDESVEIINPDHVIATMTSDVHFVVEMTVENGRGYVAATDPDKDHEIGIIPLDAVFSPVTRVSYRTDEARIGQRTNYDRLVLEIWTNGTVTPEMALVEAAKILRKHLNPFVNYSEPGPEVPMDELPFEFQAPRDMADPELETKLNMSLAELELSVRATNCLESEGITTVRELVSRDDEKLLTVRNFGETTLREVKEKLKKYNLSLGMKLPDHLAKK
jgi:DNA-directed RNA polymerase subunit alpha